jgi:hypothetical protein
MTYPEGRITVKPEVVFIEQLLNDIAAGTLRVPKFQRPFVWRPEQMVELFDSIERGYPIGSLLIWETDLHVTSLDEISDQKIPRTPRTSTTYVLDGHQRLSTLFGTLMPRSSVAEPTQQREWMWNIYRVLGDTSERSRFTHWKKTTKPPPWYLPMRAMLRTMDFLAWARELQKADKLPADIDVLIREAEELAQRIKSYQTSVVRLIGGDLERAVGVFHRLNSSGQSMTPDQMASALTYREGTGESLADRISALQDSIADTGFGEIASITIYRSILAVAGVDDVQETRWEALAKRVEENLTEAVDATEVALHNAVDFLRQEVRVPLARLVPYNAQIMLLAACFDRAPSLGRPQREELVRWFWATSWSGHFAGANSTQIRNALREMREFALGRSSLSFDDQIARPFPDRFDTRAARVRAYIVWDLIKFPDRRGLDNRPVDAVDLIAKNNLSAYRSIIPGISQVSHPANKIILPTPARMSARRALTEHGNFQIWNSHGITESALWHLKRDNFDQFLTDRTEFLVKREREFMDKFDVRLPEMRAGETDIDTE